MKSEDINKTILNRALYINLIAPDIPFFVATTFGILFFCMLLLHTLDNSRCHNAAAVSMICVPGTALRGDNTQ